MRLQSATHGLPWLGYNSTLSRQLVPPGYATADSRGALLSPLEGCFYRRGGTGQLGGANGVLEIPVAEATMRGVQVLELSSPSFSDGYPTYAILFTDEAKHYGQIYWRSTNGADSDQVIGKSFGSTHYPTGATPGDFKCVPFPYVDNATGYSRCATEPTRRYVAQGSRNCLSVGGWLYFPGTGLRWNKRFNDAVGSGTERERLMPTGHIPPMWAPTITAQGGTASVSPWQQNEQFYVGVAFVWEDDSVSMPFMPRAANATLASGLGLVTLGTGSAYYRDLLWSNIPCGPAGVKARLLLRSPKVLSTASPYAPPTLKDLLIVDIIENNTSTSYVDSGGSDGGLLADDTRIRRDHRLPPTARYIWGFDQRIAVGGHLQPSRFAIFIAPSGSATSRDINGDDDSALIYGSVTFYISFQSDEGSANARLLLRKVSGGATTSTKIDLYSGATPKTLQAVVDEINATVVGGAGGEWVACIAPGADPNAAVTNLAPLSHNLSCTTNSTTTLTTAASFADVAVGMKVTGTDIPAGCYVKAVASTTSLTLSAAATGAHTSTLTFFSDVGDEGIIGAGNPDGTYNATIDYNGIMRCFAGSYPGALGWKKSYLDGFPVQDQEIMFTGASPGHAANAANNYYVGNIRSLASSFGRVMGGVPLHNGNIVAWVPFSNGTGVIRNLKGGGTAADEDYRLLTASYTRGVKSPYSVVAGDGWAGGLTQDGFVVTSGEVESERIISFDYFDPAKVFTADSAGQWQAEVAACLKAAAGDTGDYFFFAGVGAGMLWVTYRNNTALTRGTSACVYNFSAGISGSGLAEVLKPDGSPWGWSSPLPYNFRAPSGSTGRLGPIGFVVTASGLMIVSTDDTNDKTTCGLVEQLENGTFTEGGGNVPGFIYATTERFGVAEKKSAQHLIVQYASEADVQVDIYRRLDRSASGVRILPTTTSGEPFSRKWIEIPQRERTVADAIEVRYLLSTAPGKIKIYGHELEADIMAKVG